MSESAVGLSSMPAELNNGGSKREGKLYKTWRQLDHISGDFKNEAPKADQNKSKFLENRWRNAAATDPREAKGLFGSPKGASPLCKPYVHFSLTVSL